MSLAAAPVAFAQSSADATELLNESNEAQSGEIFSGSGLDFGDLIHRANQAGGLSEADYREQQQRNFDEATADYLQRRQQGSQQPSGEAVNSDSSNDSLEVGL